MSDDSKVGCGCGGCLGCLIGMAMMGHLIREYHLFFGNPLADLAFITIPVFICCGLCAWAGVGIARFLGASSGTGGSGYSSHMSHQEMMILYEDLQDDDDA